MTDAVDLATALSRPDAYPFPVDRVEVRRTHVSMLFFAGERVYKIKRPVDLGFLDFSTPARREFFCHEEVRLNRRLAPDVYLGVVPVLETAPGIVAVAASGYEPPEGRACEAAVEMRRLPARRMLDHLLDQGAVDNGMLDAIVDVLVRFHRDAPTGPGVNEHGTPSAVRDIVMANLQRVDEQAPTAASPALRRHLAARLDAKLVELDAQLRRRVETGRIREGHGDLHAGNICVADGVAIYDCIEFDRALRCVDTARDLAFLVMDLDMRGFRGFGRYVVHRYAEEAGDRELPAVLPLYKAHLAAVRGWATALAGDLDSARRYLHLATGYTLPASLVLMSGLPGTGKSWAARHVARPLGAAIVRTDVVRKRLAGIPPDRHPSGAELEALYSAAADGRTYGRVLEECRAFLAEGRPVVVDATFGRRQRRDAFRALATELGVPVLLVAVTTPESVVEARLRRRRARSGEVSDADLEVYRLAQARFEPIDEVPVRGRVAVDGTAPAADTVTRVLDALIAQTE